tara:strand:+ start:271 stop:1287 length:1017 start_codon:yes stop_codon:yes gene_type:complete
MARQPEKDADQVARIAAAQMGAPAPEPKPEPKEAPETPQEKAVAAASPETEGDKSQAEAIIYNVKIGDQDRQLSPSQIAGTYERYRDLNFKQAQMKPVNDLAGLIMEKTGKGPEEAAKLMAAGLKAMSKNAQMGQARPKQEGVAQPVAPQQGDAASASAKLNEEFQKYEDENAISLPPGYQQMNSEIAEMKRMMGQMVNMNQNIMQQAMAAGQQGNQSREEAMQSREDAIANTIRNNLDKAQQQAGLPDEALDDFRAYALERGYTAEDFADMGLTSKVVNDFKNQMNAPEFERIREMAARREAYLRSQSGGPTSQAAETGGDDTLARLAANAMNKRMG